MKAHYLACLLACLILSGCAQTLESSPSPARAQAHGPKMSPFSLVAPTGEKVDFTPGAKFEVTVLSFWSLTWNPDNEAHLAQLKALKASFKDRPLRIIAIAYDEEPATVRKFLDLHPQDFEVAMGDGKLYDALQLEDLPTTLLVAPDGSQIDRVKGQPGAEQMAEKIRPFFPQ